MADHGNLPVRNDPMSGEVGAPLPYQAAGHGYEQEAPGPFSPKRLLRAVVRYKWLVLALTVAGSVAAVFATRHMELSYTAESRLWIEVSARGDGLRGPIQSPELLRAEAWLELLRAFAVLDHVVRDQQLYLRYSGRDADLLTGLDISPEQLVPGNYTLRYSRSNNTVELRSQEGGVIERVRHGEPIGTAVGMKWQPAFSTESDRSVAFTLLSPRDAASQLNRQLNARLARGGNFLWITYTAPDPHHAARVANAVSERYVALAAELKRAKLDELRDILERQMQYAEENLRDAELAYERFRVATITLPSDAAPVAAGIDETSAPVMSNFFSLKMEREHLQRERTAIQRALASRDGVSVDALSAINSVRQSPELMQALSDLASKRAERRALQLQFTDEHPLVVGATQDIEELERGTVPVLARRLSAELGQQMAQVDGLVAGASSELREIPARAIDQARFRREVATSENLFNDLRQRYEGARLAAETTVPDVRVLDTAMPPRNPSLDQRLRLLLAGIAGSFALGLMLAVGLDRMDPRLRYAEQVTDDMGLNVIGAVPSLLAPRRLPPSRAGKHVVAAQAGPQMIEALRAVRLNLAHAYGSAGPMIVTITSPGAGDGKSFMTANLALSYADLGRRVLIIDGDTRRGCMHHVFTVDRQPGLTEYLQGEVPLHEIVRSTDFPLVSLIPSGTRLTNAPELLSSPLLGDLLASVKADYDTVLIDSPPLGAGVDPLVLGTLAGNLLLVMRTGNTQRAIAEAKLRMLDRLPVRVLGTVLNGFNSTDSYRYYSYMPGYEAGDEQENRSNLLQRG
jgi:polysaccharide biosynthesis transport protein